MNGLEQKTTKINSFYYHLMVGLKISSDDISDACLDSALLSLQHFLHKRLFQKKVTLKDKI